MSVEPQSAPLARQVSVRSVIETILHRGPISRSEIARITGLSKQTTSEVVRELEEGGFIRTRGRIQGAVGRSATTYVLDQATAFALGVDLGGTKLHVALADLTGAVVGEMTEPTDSRGGLAVVEQIGRLTEELARASSVPMERIRVGVMGSPGVIEPGTGAIAIAPNIPELDRIDVPAELKARLGLAFQIENDVNLAAKGEQWRGQSRGARTFAFIALGTGIGMGIVMDGHLMRGARGAAGEIAYLPLGGDPYDSGGFRLGTLETAVGSAAIVRRYLGYGGRSGDTVKAIFQAAAGEEPAALATIEETARLLAPAIAAVAAVLDPELIVIGGSIGVRPELVDPIRRLLPRCMPAPIRLEISTLGSRATLIGALGVGLNRLHNSLFGLTALPGEFVLPAIDDQERTASA